MTQECAKYGVCHAGKEHPEYRGAFFFTEAEGQVKEEVEENDDNYVPAVHIGHMKTGQIP